MALRERNAFFALLVILIIATVLRTYQLERIPPGLYPDEAMNGVNALQALGSGDFKIYYADNNGREGLFINIQAFILKSLGGVTEPWVLRLPSALIGILTVWGTYLLGKELFSKRVGLAASFFLATSFWHLVFSRIGFRAVMAPFFLVWALYLFHLAVRKAGEKSPGFIFPAIAGGLLFGLGFHTYIAYRVAPLLLVLFWWFFRKNDWFWHATLIFLGAAFLAGLPIGLYYLQNPADFLGRTSQISVWSSPSPLRDLTVNILKTAGMFNFRGDFNWRHNFPGRAELFWPVGILFLAGICVGLRNVFRRTGGGIVPMDHGPTFENWETVRNLRFGFLLMFTWLILALLPVIISNEGLPHALRAILMIPPVMILAGTGAVWTYNYLRRHTRDSAVLPIAATLLALLIIYQVSQVYFIMWGRNPHTAGAFAKDYADIARTLDRLPRQVPKYVVVEAGGVGVDYQNAFLPDRKSIPVPAMTVMFMTDTYFPEDQRAKNVHYLLPEDVPNAPKEGLRFYIR